MALCLDDLWHNAGRYSYISMNYMGNSFSCWESLLIVNYGDFFYKASRRFSICDIEFLPFLPDGAKRNVISSTFFVANT